MEESGKEKWTPGPWSVQPNAHDVPCIVQGPNYRVAVAHRQENRPNEATAAANARLIAAAPALYEALSGVEFIFARPGESSVDRFERLAEAFYRDTGLLAPGKDAPAAGGQPDDDVRRERYDAWIDARLSAARSALLLANTGETENG